MTEEVDMSWRLIYTMHQVSDDKRSWCDKRRSGDVKILLPHNPYTKDSITINEPEVVKNLIFPSGLQPEKVAIEISIDEDYPKYKVKIGPTLSVELHKRTHSLG